PDEHPPLEAAAPARYRRRSAKNREPTVADPLEWAQFRIGGLVMDVAVSPDMRFDREISTPGLIAPRHWYSNGLVGPRPTTSRGSTMPPPIPVPIRQAIFRLWQQGCGTRQIVASTGLPSPTVRRFLQRFRHRGRDGILADYRGPSA